jgi:hypothetical protein
LLYLFDKLIELLDEGFLQRGSEFVEPVADLGRIAGDYTEQIVRSLYPLAAFSQRAAAIPQEKLKTNTNRGVKVPRSIPRKPLCALYGKTTKS